MIKFFRRIRQRLVVDPPEPNHHVRAGNKLSKPSSPARPNNSSRHAGNYLLYAIGEIVLIVIFILIALQINNWNEAQKNLAKEQQFLVSLQEEFKQSIKELSFDHQINLSSINATTTRLNFDKNAGFKTNLIIKRTKTFLNL